MYHIAAIGHDRMAYDNLYGLFKGLDSLHVPISEDLAWKLLDAVKDHRGNKDAYLSEQRKKELIVRLKKELIIKQTYWTRQGLPLIDRERDIEAIITKLQEEGIQFLTLIGLPGVGKTEIARQIEDWTEKKEHFTHVHFMPLESVRSASDVLHMIDDHLLRTDTQGRTLLILDNCEQIQWIETLRAELYKRLSKQKLLTILATSRAIFSENMYEVLPLPVPQFTSKPLEELQSDSSAKLFLNCVKRNDAHFTLTEQNAYKILSICNALGGLPLAILIAGSWVKELGIEGVYASISNRYMQELEYNFRDSKRHMSLNELIAWSYNLLPQEEQTLFRRLAIFSDGCLTTSAKEVCNLGDLPTNESAFINLLRTLSNHNLIHFINKRIKIGHITLYEFVTSKLTNKEAQEELDKLCNNFINNYIALIKAVIKEHKKSNHVFLELILTEEKRNICDTFNAVIKSCNHYYTSEMKKILGEKTYRAIDRILLRALHRSFIEHEDIKIFDEDLEIYFNFLEAEKKLQERNWPYYEFWDFWQGFWTIARPRLKNDLGRSGTSLAMYHWLSHL